MWIALACFAFLALAGTVAFLSRCPVMIQTTHERDSERVVHVVTGPTQVQHVHHVHQLGAAHTAPHAYPAAPSASGGTTQGPTCLCGCGLPLSQVQGAPALGPAPDAAAVMGRVVPGLERPQR